MTKHFIDYVQKILEVDPIDRRISWMYRNHHIWSDFLVDETMANFLTFMHSHHMKQGTTIKPNLRAIHGWVAYSITRNGRSKSEFPNFKPFGMV